MKKNILKNNVVQSLIASLSCIILGLLIGYIVLLFINPNGAWEAMMTVVKNFLTYSKPEAQLKNFGNTLVKTAPLLMCALSVLFAYKVGLFNIGAAGQYVAGSCAALYAALAWHWSWLPCMIFAIVAGAVLGALVGVLKSYCNVNEVISGIMLNWISLYTTNMILNNVKEPTSPYTYQIASHGRDALLPSLGLEKLFNNNKYVSIAIPLAIIIAIIIAIVLDKTKFGYELKATGNNKNAAKYCGMAEKRNMILSLVIAGGLAGLGGSLLYQTGFEQWLCTASSFIQHITTGGAYVDKTMYCSQISDLISSIIIYLCGFVFFLKYAMNRAIAAREEKKAHEEKAAAKKAAEGGEK